MTSDIDQPLIPLKIAVLAHLHHPISSPFAGGMESHTAHLIAGLSLRGHRVTLFAKEGSQAPENGATVSVRNVLSRHYAVQGYPDDDLRNEQHRSLDAAMAAAIRAVRQEDFDLVINNSLSPIPHRALVGIPTLHILHTPPLPRITALLAREDHLFDPKHRYVTISESNARPWRTWIPRISIVPNGIDLKLWRSSRAPVPGTAAWTGRITPEKGTHLAIRAAQELGLQLKFAGPIQDCEYFTKLIHPLLGHGTEYLGHLDQEELKILIASAEVFISSPMWEEPFGLTTLEAMACGTPVAALPAGAMREILGDRGGAVAHEAEVPALASAIELARKLDRDSVRERAQLFSEDNMLNGYEELMYQVTHTAELIGRSYP